MQQHTLCRAVAITGIGLHSAHAVQLVLSPASPETGIVFYRNDLNPPVRIPARLDNVSDTHLATTLSADGASVATVEHLLAALRGTGVDNVLVELDAPEVPIMDGSAEPFVDAILSAGLQPQGQPRSFLRILEPVSVQLEDKTAAFLPHEGFRIDFTIDFDQPVFRERTARAAMDFSAEHFASTVSRARTFGFIHEIEYLRGRGLALGGSFDNAVVVDDYRILNEGGLRSEDEFVQHKVLDAMGDLALLPHPLIGEYRAHKAGHTLNHAALSALMDRPRAWEIVTFDDAAAVPPGYATMVNQGRI